jgi:hypothetical protein
MKSLREKLKQISTAMEFANVDTLREFEGLLESRESSAPAPIRVRRTAAGRAAHMHRERGEGQTIIDFAAYARRAVLKPSGQY